jgi:hypothetical protein
LAKRRAPKEIRTTHTAIAASLLALVACGRIGYDDIAGTREGNSSADGSTASGGTGAGGLSGGTGARDGGGATSAVGGTSGSGAAGAGGTAGNGGRDAAVADAALDGSLGPGCGNGRVDVGEECDDRGASATCDADCTFASCGDGVLNTLAGEECDSADQVATCGANCKLETARTGCTIEWYLGRRYMFCPDKLNFTPATAACDSFGMRMVRITSGQESSWVRLRTQQDGDAKFHIGASDAASEGVWLWEDGTQFWSGGNAASGGKAVNLKFAWWATGEPNNQGGIENCGECQSIQGWNDSRCDFEAKPFVCKQYRDPRATCGNGVVDPGEACDMGKATSTCDNDCSPVVCGDGVVNAAAGEACDDGGQLQYCSKDCSQFLPPPAGCQLFSVGSGSYAMCTTPKTFRDAALACGRVGMALAQIPSSTIDQGLRTQATSSSVTEYWVGGLDLDAEGQWMWTSTIRFRSGTTTSAYDHFVAGGPTGGTAANCLKVLATGEWSDADCATVLPYVCERIPP